MSGSSFECDCGQMTTAVLEVDEELERCAGFSAEVVDFEVGSTAWTGRVEDEVRKTLTT